MASQELTGNSRRRIVLFDFVWEDADLLPELLRLPGIAVRLVAGTSAEDAGVRVAELCGLPRTVELADLTREIFDLALLSDRSPRRPQVERLLNALGTPTASPRDFMRSGARTERRAGANSTPAPGEDVAGWALEAPGPAAPDAATPAATPRLEAAQSEESLPACEDQLGLERTLAAWQLETRASAVELHIVEGETLRRVCRCGPEDPMLAALMRLAHQLDTAHVVVRVDGPQRNRLWGVWPFRTRQRCALLAAAAADATGAGADWAERALALRAAWDRLECPGEAESAERPLLNLLHVDAFLHRLEMAVDRNRTDGFRFALHRIRFEGTGAEVEALTQALPEQLRGTDCLCRHGTREILLMCVGPVNAFVHLRRRIVTLWERAWRDCGNAGPAPPIADERVEMSDPDDARSFLAAAHSWLAGA